MLNGTGADGAGRVPAETGGLTRRLQAAGADAPRLSSNAYGGLVMDGYLKLVQESLRGGVDLSHHLLSLMGARTPLDVFRMNLDFMQKQMASLQGRLPDPAPLRLTREE